MALNNKQIAGIVTVIVCFLVIVIASVWWYGYDHDSSQNTVTENFNTSSLRYVAIIFRHGERGPLFSCKDDPKSNDFPEGPGELTRFGKQHMYKKGQIFRKLYNGFLSNLYLRNEIYTKTTHSERTFMSAAMVLAGLYPPIDYQKWSSHETVWTPIPIYSESPDHGLLFSEKGICPAFDKFIQSSHLNALEDSEENSKLLSYLSEKCGKEINDGNLNGLYDLQMCMKGEGLPLPKWITPEVLHQIKSNLFSEKALRSINGNVILQKFIIGPLLKEIGLNMKSHSTNSNNNENYKKTKMNLYSGHDVSILMAMGLLNNVIEIPSFGASLHFHLYNDEDNGYTIKVFYYKHWDDEKGEEVFLPKCGDPCKVQNFIDITTTPFPESWAEECQK